LEGGIPLTFDGKVIGAMGVSGNTPQEDEDIAMAGAAVAEAAHRGAARCALKTAVHHDRSAMALAPMRRSAGGSTPCAC
jgi:hypothetical protein